jgi:hypothetical protein
MNPFEQFAEAQIASPVKARTRAAEKRRELLNRKTEDQTSLLREWRRWRQEQLVRTLAGPHGRKIDRLVNHLKAVARWDDVNADNLTAEWRAADPDTRFIVTRIVNDRIIELREAANLPPFDDEIPSFERAAA